ncbi:MAG: glycosyltransferase, partial [Alistipes sp.]|nr:glycosyltransferase [Alistipes sp.]
MIRLSLIIPTHNRSRQLLEALRSVVGQTADPALWECLVVNNASTDDTEERFAAFAAEHPEFDLRMVSE